MKYRVGDDTRNLQSCRHMTGFKMDASFRFSSEDVVKPVCEISPLGTFERRCLTPRCSRNLPQAKYRQRSWLLETGASEISSIFAFLRVRMVSVAFIEIRPSGSFHKPESRSRLTTFWRTLASVLFVAGLPTSRDFICDELRITIFTDF